jgi:hypothetical protein
MAGEVDKRDPGINRTTPAPTSSLNNRAREVSESPLVYRTGDVSLGM